MSPLPQNAQKAAEQQPINVIDLAAKIIGGEKTTVSSDELVAMAAALTDFDPALHLASEAIVLLVALGQRPTSKDLRRAADDTLVRLRDKLRQIHYYNWDDN